MSAPNCSVRASSPGLSALVEDQRMEIAVAGMEDIGDAQACLLRQLGHVAQHRRQLGARNGRVDAIVIGRDAADGGKRGLAPGPEEQPFLLAGGDPRRYRATQSLGDALDAGSIR